MSHDPAGDDAWWRRQEQEQMGAARAVARAGSWPRYGTLQDYQAATDRAVREARRIHEIEYRWMTRFRWWERPDHPSFLAQSPRLGARIHTAIEIAEDREWLLRRICDVTLGSA